MAAQTAAQKAEARRLAAAQAKLNAQASNKNPFEPELEKDDTEEGAEGADQGEASAQTQAATFTEPTRAKKVSVIWKGYVNRHWPDMHGDLLVSSPNERNTQNHVILRVGINELSAHQLDSIQNHPEVARLIKGKRIIICDGKVPAALGKLEEDVALEFVEACSDGDLLRNWQRTEDRHAVLVGIGEQLKLVADFDQRMADQRALQAE